MISDKVVLANQLNLYFSNIGSNIASQIVISDEKSYTDYLHSPCKIEFKFKEITVQYTKEIIDSLKAKSSCGVDGLSVKLLKLIKGEIATSLTLVINQSLLSGIFPDQLNIAKVIPIYIYEKDDPAIFGNYRPISILPAIYTTKIDGVVCPPNISETVAVRTVKLAHRPRIASTTTKFISKPILLSI